MKLTEKINKTLGTGLIGLSLLAATVGCSTTPSQPAKPIHKDCYGLHIKENSDNITVEFYKEGWQQFKQQVNDTIYIVITNDDIKYTQKDFTKTYKLEMHPENTSR